jgi:hypothetical protein
MPTDCTLGFQGRARFWERDWANDLPIFGSPRWRIPTCY